MKELTIIASDKINYTEQGDVIFWEGQNNSLDKMLADKLLDIRANHMKWACDMADLSIDDKKTLADFLQVDSDTSMWWLSQLYERHPRISPWLYPLYKLRVLEEFIKENNYNKLHLTGGDGELEKTLQRFCEHLQIPFSSKSAQTRSKKQSLIATIYKKIPAHLRAVIRLINWLFSIRLKLPLKPASFNPATNSDNLTATIATYFPNIDMVKAKKGQFRSRYWESLHDALNQEAQHASNGHFCRWLFIYYPSPQLSFRECIELRNQFVSNGKDGLSFNFLEEFLGAGDIWKAVKKWLKISFKSYKCQKIFAQNCKLPNSRFNFWPLASYDWQESFRGWRCLERCLQNIAFENYYKMAGPQRWQLFPLENCPWERMLTAKARKSSANGPVIGAQHSIIRPTDFRYFDAPETFAMETARTFQPDYICANGSSSYRQWSENNLPQNRLKMVEALRYQYLAEYVKEDNYKADKENSRLLIATSFFREETSQHLELLMACLKDGFLDGWKFFIKPHPYLPVDNWLDNVPEKYRQHIQIISEPLKNALVKADLLWASNSTTAAIEGLLAGLPVMVMRNQGEFDLCPVQDIQAVMRVGAVDEVKNNLKNLRKVSLASDYLLLDPALHRWKKMLGLQAT